MFAEYETYRNMSAINVKSIIIFPDAFLGSAGAPCWATAPTVNITTSSRDVRKPLSESESFGCSFSHQTMNNYAYQ